MLLRGLECDSFTSHGDNVRSYVQLVLQRLHREMGLEVLQLCQQFGWKRLHSISERWLIATAARFPPVLLAEVARWGPAPDWLLLLKGAPGVVAG